MSDKAALSDVPNAATSRKTQRLLSALFCGAGGGIKHHRLRPQEAEDTQWPQPEDADAPFYLSSFPIVSDG